MVFTNMLSNAVIAQAVPTAMYAAFGNDRVRTAASLGRISSCAALMDIMLTPQLGRLSDTIGRKPLLLAAPALALACRAFAAVRPTVGVLVACKLLSLTLTSTFSVALRAALADCHHSDPHIFTGRLGLVSASAGAAYSVGMYLGGRLVSRQLVLPYIASAALLACLLPITLLGFRETLPRSARSPFGLRPPAFGFLRLFRSGPALRSLLAVSALHTISMAMGDTWQVFARELRGWGAETCGLFGSLSGLGHTATALLARRSVRRLGARGHTMVATAGCAATELALGLGSTGVAFGMLPVNWVGRTQGMAVTARITQVGNHHAALSSFRVRVKGYKQISRHAHTPARRAWL
jgi:predicted MFS family arabinose efflux permease